jgi:hypothetical protein
MGVNLQYRHNPQNVSPVNVFPEERLFVFNTRAIQKYKD